MTLKLVTPKKLPPAALTHPNISGQRFNEWLIALPPDHALEDCLSPSYWSHVAAKLRPLDVLRIISNDNSFDLSLTVVDLFVGGVRVAIWPHYPPGFSPEARVDATPAELTPVPILPN